MEKTRNKQIRPLRLKGYVCYFTKWQIGLHSLIPKVHGKINIEQKARSEKNYCYALHKKFRNSTDACNMIQMAFDVIFLVSISLGNSYFYSPAHVTDEIDSCVK